MFGFFKQLWDGLADLTSAIRDYAQTFREADQHTRERLGLAPREEKLLEAPRLPNGEETPRKAGRSRKG